MDEELWSELSEMEVSLRDEAEQLRRTAAGMREAALQHEGKALGLIAAADRLRAIERPE